ncbi:MULTISPECIES: EAL and HDOD domain-containing protein [unclassified Vibrio]|uniref:EAL domain-containing protein n=1 Tax=Vibrio sp. HB236076 TaxID=3232307 RepID=A0AB39HEN3_9VIBR|nr:EAL domain-containing protein [Vibrio sp. HB161653]MDP5255183.1 EAL domain-containing protein [Vibrio sp. HB161653]
MSLIKLDNTNQAAFSYAARQPIVNKSHQLVAFELLYRNGEDNVFPNVAPDVATQNLYVEQLLLGQGRILDSHLGFVNFDIETLKKRMPLDFPPNQYVIEIVETCHPNAELLDIVRELKASGLKIALDDFIPDPLWQEFYQLVDYIKLDIRALSLAQCQEVISALSHYNIVFLAEKVENHDEFEQCLRMGFELFQGYYFQKPEMIKHRKVIHSVNSSLRLCQAVAQCDLDIDLIESIISSDATLSFKLLNFVNSSAAVSSKIRSFRQAIIYLGAERLRKFSSYTAIASLGEHKPPVLLKYSLYRAKLFQCLLSKDSDEAQMGYLCGLLSLMDAILDNEMSTILKPLQIDEEVSRALIEKRGRLGLLLRLIEAREHNFWSQAAQLAHHLNLTEQQIIECDIEASLWLDELFSHP